jgi:hypothetical protein
MTVGYPTSHHSIEGLVREHRELADEPLLLAIYYAPSREPQDIFLFEIFAGYGADGIDADRKLFEVSYNGRSDFPLEPGQHLRLVLTNVPEFKRAIDESWTHIRELKHAIAQGRYEVVFAHPDHPELARLLGV